MNGGYASITPQYTNYSMTVKLLIKKQMESVTIVLSRQCRKEEGMEEQPSESVLERSSGGISVRKAPVHQQATRLTSSLISFCPVLALVLISN